MTLASSGYIRMGGTDSGRSVNVELGNSPTATITMPSTATRTLTGVASGPIVLPNDYWGKSSVAISLASIESGTPFAAEQFAPGEPCIAELTFNSNGTWDFYAESLAPRSGNWATPTTAGVGTGYWIQWTRTAFFGGPGNSATGTSGWQQLSTAPNISAYNSGTVPTVSAQYNIYIATDSSGSNIVAGAGAVQVTATTNN